MHWVDFAKIARLRVLIAKECPQLFPGKLNYLRGEALLFVDEIIIE